MAGTQKNIVRGERDRREIEFEGLWLVCERVALDGSNIKPGDLYLAKRNGPWKLLTMREFGPIGGDYIAWIHPVENGYPFDTHECWKVIEGV